MKPETDLHGHCHEKQCVLFFEKVYKSPNFLKNCLVYSNRPFPHKTPVTIPCLYDDFFRVNGGNPAFSQVVCTKVITAKENGYNDVPELSCYALIAVNDQPFLPLND